jgi:hypothetical protein
MRRDEGESKANYEQQTRPRSNLLLVLRHFILNYTNVRQNRTFESFSTVGHADNTTLLQKGVYLC